MVLCIGLVVVFICGMIQWLLIFVGLIVVCLLYGVMINVLGLGKVVDFIFVSYVVWFGLLYFFIFVFNGQVMMLIVFVVVILVVENLGYFKVVVGMIGCNMDLYMGWVFVGDGLVMMFFGFVGGSGVIIYVENIGVMVVIKVYLMLVFVVVVVIVMLLGFLLKFGVLIYIILVVVIGGVLIVVFGLIVVVGVRIWV